MSKKDDGEHVFIVGSSRSGTTLLNSILMSCPDYAVYRAETQVLNGCELKYGDLSNKRNRNSFLADWFKSRQHHRSGLTEEELLAVFDKENKPSYVWFLSEYMGKVASKQNKNRWVDSTPGNVFNLREISKYFPNAKFILVVRDGRAVALSRAKLGWCGIGSKNYDTRLGYSALMWERSVKAAYDAKKELSERMLEVKYEDLIEKPEKVTNEISKFLDISKLDYHHINTQDNSKSTSKSSGDYNNNSAFSDLTDGISNSAAYRWESLLTKDQISKLEGFIGETLAMNGYSITQQGSNNFRHTCEKFLFNSLLRLKGRIKRMKILRKYLTTPLELGLD